METKGESRTTTLHTQAIQGKGFAATMGSLQKPLLNDGGGKHKISHNHHIDSVWQGSGGKDATAR